ncbi:hypothetical protein FRC10_002815 [Ceratobasidium sp. 414]|nr:hypothetical protein FRC10_002815 [Ceratobasidium sp. 414]
MARKRKSGFASVLSSLPPDLKAAFSARPDQTTEEAGSQSFAPNDSGDLIVQRVHVAQVTPGTHLDEDLLDSVDLAASPLPLKKQRTSGSATSPDSAVVKITPASTLNEQMRIAAPHYKTQKQVPQHLKKCARLFIQISTNDIDIFRYTMKGAFLTRKQPRLLNGVVAIPSLMLFVESVGTRSLSPKHVNEVSTVLTLLRTSDGRSTSTIAKHNATIYGVADRIEFILCDYISFANSFSSLPKSQQRRVDVVFLSPPWGGPSYISGSLTTGKDADSEGAQSSVYTLNSLVPLPGPELFALSSKISPNIAMFLPRNTDVEEISALAPPGQSVEIEEEWTGSKLKALTCYFGGLARGQGHLF